MPQGRDGSRRAVDRFVSLESIDAAAAGRMRKRFVRAFMAAAHVSEEHEKAVGAAFIAEASRTELRFSFAPAGGSAYFERQPLADDFVDDLVAELVDNWAGSYNADRALGDVIWN